MAKKDVKLQVEVKAKVYKTFYKVDLEATSTKLIEMSQFVKRKEKSFYLHLQKGGTEGKTGSPGGNLQAGINKNKEKKKENEIKPCIYHGQKTKRQNRLEVKTNLKGVTVFKLRVRLCK